MQISGRDTVYRNEYITGKSRIGKLSKALDLCARNVAPVSEVGISITDKGDSVNAKQVIDEVMSLPVDERALVVDVLLRSLNQPESDMDKKWSIEAKRRLSEFRAGRVVAVAGDEVFGRVRRRFEG